nr:MAG TPA: hypothetical protein [Caudoviricetes sp.]
MVGLLVYRMCLVSQTVLVKTKPPARKVTRGFAHLRIL